METTHFLVNFDPVFLDLGLFKIHWYGITYLIAFGLFLLLGYYRIKNRPSGWNKEQLSDCLFFGALGVIIGGRVGWYLFYSDTPFSEDPLLIFKIADGGMSFHGGLVGVLLALMYFKRKTGKRYFEVSDFVAPLVPLGIFAVRIGNFVNGELWGRMTNKSWGMIFPESLPSRIYHSGISSEQLESMNASGALSGFARHPSTLYEAFGEGLITFILVWLAANYAKKEGTTSAVFLISYGCARFAAEFFREPDSNRGYVLFDWMTMGQILSLPLIIAGITILLFARRKRNIS